MEVYGYVYMVRNKVNGKLYFGITEDDFDTRYGGSIAKHTHNEHLKRSIKKYGIENFEINKEFDVAYNEDDLYDLEDMYICLYNTLDSRYGYNKKRSGSKHKSGGKMSEESKKKMSEVKKTLYEQGFINPMYGKHHVEETKKKISESRKGNKNPRSRSIICIETKQVFTTIQEAREWLGKGDIAHHLRGKLKSAGKHPITGEKLHWMYYEDYLAQHSCQRVS